VDEKVIFREGDQMIEETIYLRNSGLEWVFTSSGFIFVREKKSAKVFVLKDNLMLVWLNLDKKMTFKKIQAATGLEDLKLNNILNIFKNYELISERG
jgi:hypothetical protein